jgi:hypothetical protein
MPLEAAIVNMTPGAAGEPGVAVPVITEVVAEVDVINCTEQVLT